MNNWKARYEANKADVDTLMGRSLGTWGKLKAWKDPNDFTDARKAAIERVERGHALYQQANFIGTTGHGAATTFYYRSPSFSFGHITQQHNIPENVGREPHRKAADYRIGNTGPDGRSQEFAHGRVFHDSRNPFVPLTQQPHGWQQLEANARADHPHLKPLANPEVRAAVDARRRR